jgi:hypothetical protein
MERKKYILYIYVRDPADLSIWTAGKSDTGRQEDKEKEIWMKTREAKNRKKRKDR